MTIVVIAYLNSGLESFLYTNHIWTIVLRNIWSLLLP